jgi:hypothetical protein
MLSQLKPASRASVDKEVKKAKRAFGRKLKVLRCARREGTRALVRLQVILNNKEWKCSFLSMDKAPRLSPSPSLFSTNERKGKYEPKKKENNQMPLEYPKKIKLSVEFKGVLYPST